MRSDGLLLASLIVRRDPARRSAVRTALIELGAQPSLSEAGRALIRAKVIAPQDFLLLQEVLESARRPCKRCGTNLVLLKALRCARCGTRNEAAEGAPDEPSERRRRRREQDQTKVRRKTSERSKKKREKREKREKTSDRQKQREKTSDRQTRREKTSDRQTRREKTTDREPRRRQKTEHKGRETARDSDRDGESARQPTSIGPYPVLERVGHGGMGVIYRIRDSTGRILALKRLRRDVSGDARQRFRREAEAIARLQHPSIVSVHEVGVDKEGLPYYTMDFVEGRELQEVRHDLEREALLSIVAKVAHGLHYAHEQGIIHRDVKPHNILIDAAGEPRIADFGLARDLGRSSLTEVGDLIGTPLFMSPEQLAGNPDLIDRRTDVYALGVVLYESLTRKLPIEANNFFELQERIRNHVPEAPSALVPSIPIEVDRIVLKALEKRPGDRYQTAEDLGEDIQRHLQGESVEAQAVPAVIRVARAARRKLVSAWGLAALCLALFVIGATAVGLVFQRRSEKAAVALAELQSRQQVALDKLANAQEALKGAHEARGSKQTLILLEAALERADDAADAAEGLGADAPSHLLREVADLRLGARRLRAETLTQGDPAQREAARLLYRELLEHTGDPNLRLALGRLELAAGHCREALEEFNEVLARDAKRVEAFYYRAESHRRTGAAHFALLDYERALTERARLVAVQPARVLVGRALAHLDLGELDKAQADLNEARKLDLQEPHLALGRGALRHAQGRNEDALQELVLGARIFPQEARLRLACGQAWVRVGDRERALVELDAALKLSTDPAVWVVRARLHALLGSDAAAEADLVQAAKRARPGDPAHGAMRLALARLRRVQRKSRQALEALEEELQGNPSADQRLEAAEVLLALPKGQGLSQALGLARGALAANPKDPRAAKVVARVLAAGGDRPGALASLVPVIEADALDAEALTLRAQFLDPGDEQTRAEARATEAQRLAVNAAAGLDLEISSPLREALSSLLRGRRLAARAIRNREAQDAPERVLSRKLLRRATLLAPWLAAGHLALAQVLEQAGDARGALEAVGEALDRGLATIPALRLQARLLADQGRAKEGLPPLAAALARAGQDTPTKRRLRAGLLLERARLRLALHLEPQALVDLDEATRLDPLLLEAFEERGNLRMEAGNAEGADEDKRQVYVLREGYVAIYDRARAQSWKAALGRSGDHVEGIRVLGPAFDVVSGERDPARRAELHLVRGYMRVRSLRLAGAMVDWAALLELAPNSSETFRQIYDEAIVFHTGDRVHLRMEPILERVLAERDVQDEVDPDFLQAFCAFAHVEFGGNDKCPPERLRTGLAASERYLERRPAHAGMLLMRASLLHADGRVGAALAMVVTTLEEPQPTPFAHYELARIQAAQRDRQGALRSLERAMHGGFDVYDQVNGDALLAEVRSLPAYPAAMGVARGESYLRQIARAEELAERDPSKARRLWGEIVASATTGIRFVLPHLKTPGSFRVLAELYLARARQKARGEKRVAALRDLSAALELAPELLCKVGQLRAATRALQPLGAPGSDRSLPRKGETYPTEVRGAIPVLLRLLFGGEAPSAEELTQARALLEKAAEERPVLGVWLAPLRQAQGNAEVALRIAREAPARPALARWFAARALVALDRAEEALGELRLAKDDGLAGPLKTDPALAKLEKNERFELMFPTLPRDPSLVWRP